jgi:glutaminase
LDQDLLTAVRQSDRRANLALVNYLTQANRLQNPDLALDTYEQICCLSGTVSDLAHLGLLLALDQKQLASQHCQLVNDVMVNCGLYEASADYAARIGLPMKSGISGALIAVVPGQGAIACYSPALDRIGNPVAGLVFVEQFVQVGDRC